MSSPVVVGGGSSFVAVRQWYFLFSHHVREGQNAEERRSLIFRPVTPALSTRATIHSLSERISVLVTVKSAEDLGNGGRDGVGMGGEAL